MASTPRHPAASVFLTLLAACASGTDSAPVDATGATRAGANEVAAGSTATALAQRSIFARTPTANRVHPDADIAATPARVGVAGAGAPQAATTDSPEIAKVEEEEIEDVANEALDDSAWQTFKQEATRTDAAGSVYYVVEWDIALRSETELRDYYDAKTSGHEDKGVVFRVPGTATDDVWANDDELHLRYCVDTNATTGFAAPGSGVSAATIIAAMAEATQAWHSVANVTYQYDSGNNGNCGISSPIPDNHYIKIARADALGGVWSFTPLSHRTIPGLDGNTIGVSSVYISSLAPPGFTWPGTLMHELGHALGLAHEHFHSVGGGCFAPDVRNVTPTVDSQSIMGYPVGAAGCALTTPNLTALSANDGWSVRTFYGMPAAWYIPTILPIGS